jgi:hypothetical protein
MKPNGLLQITDEAAEAYYKAKDKVRKETHERWKNWEYPPYYEYRPPFRNCWNFITLPKFQSGRVHQMRSSKSYLNAQTDWSSEGRNTQCDRCGEAPQTFQHIIQECPALAEFRIGQDPEMFNIAPQSALWEENKGGELVKKFSSFVTKHIINFPVKRGVFPFTKEIDLRS